MLWRSMVLLSYLAHAYVWHDPTLAPPTTLPTELARPWVAVAAALGIPPVLNYATYVLLNWQRIDPAGPVALGNITSLTSFTASKTGRSCTVFNQTWVFQSITRCTIRHG